jgi:hypothetical protein
MSRDEKRLAWLLAVVLTLWVTESWHGVGPAWTGLAAAVITLLPRVGFISGEEFSSGVNMHLYLRRRDSWAGDHRDANRYRRRGGECCCRLCRWIKRVRSPASSH